MERIYYDHAATTPLHPEAARAMLEVLQGPPANASSLHSFGRDARKRVSAARDAIAATIGCRPDELVFTSGGTEADNYALRGVLEAQAASGKRHLVTSAAEHHAVLKECERLQRGGWRVTVLPVDGDGLVSPDQLRDSLSDDTGLVSIMYANNETGVLQPIAELAAAAQERGVPFHTDAAQAYGKLPIDVAELPISLMTLSSHKINGPQGVGALFVRQGTPLAPLLVGGSQERKRRGGTENVAALAGFARAAELAARERERRAAAMEQLRELWLRRMAEVTDGAAVLLGHPERRLPGIVNLAIPGFDRESLLMNLDLAGIAASGGSACTAGALEPSHVLQAMGVPEELSGSAVRFSFGLGNTTEEMELAAERVETFLGRNRKSS
ncbi:cysteine desulfurase family protein [Paenibacillus pasadenensis]|uniref:cysteine desulfurase family protein n=1 Tax=Paenibacillus TaxID=44249 RepID=UPI000425FDD1|nr:MULTISPECIES: cysteine desulfurase family protein [Paenibacillus]QGG57221.1 aminotransferase class V-fold PLP-dependent enzyme [Paenibacillus sp. B01]